MEIINNVPVELSVEQALKALHMDGDSKYAGMIQELIDRVQAIARPKAIYDIRYIRQKGEKDVDIDGIRFTSRILRVNLDEAERVFPYIATCGTEVEELDAETDDLMIKFALDIIKQMVLGNASKRLREHVNEKYRPEKFSSISPGSLEDWPISEQKPLFSLFGDVESLIGVKLTDSFLMLPLKSVSGMFFETEVSFQSCQLCPRERCPRRRAPYDEKLKDKYLLDKETPDA